MNQHQKNILFVIALLVGMFALWATDSVVMAGFAMVAVVAVGFMVAG